MQGWTIYLGVFGEIFLRRREGRVLWRGTGVVEGRAGMFPGGVRSPGRWRDRQ